MNFTLTYNNAILPVVPGLPSDFRGPILKLATAYHGQSDYASVVIQELKDEFYAIRFVIIKALKGLYARELMQPSGLYCQFMLKNNLRKKFSNFGRLHMRQDQYLGIYGLAENCETKIDSVEEIRTLQLFCSPKLLEELLPYFPQLGTILQSESSGILHDCPAWMIQAMKDSANDLLQCPYNELTQKFYFDLKVRELLYLVLENSFSVSPAHQQFNFFEAAKIHEARSILASFIDKKPISIRALAKKVSLNEYKLKVGFKYFFKTGILEWLIEAKMQHARHLILTTNRPIKDICMEVGYPRTTNFITAFRRRFGCTPGSLRRS